MLAFAHNSHLQEGNGRWQLGPDLLEWWPAGSHLGQMLGPRYVVIGSAVGVSDANGIGQPEDGTLEALLTATPGPARFIPTHNGQGLSTSEESRHFRPAPAARRTRPTSRLLLEASPTSTGWPCSIRRHTIAVGRRCNNRMLTSSNKKQNHRYPNTYPSSRASRMASQSRWRSMRAMRRLGRSISPCSSMAFMRRGLLAR